MRKKILVVLIIAVLFFSSISLAIALDRKNKDDLYRQVEIFSDAVAAIETDYVDEVKAKDLIYGALRGMLSSLDPHSQFMDPDTFNELKADTEGRFGGVGIEITVKDGQLTVITPIEDTPAWRAGLKPGDRIVKINNALTRGMDLNGAMKELRGKPGVAVTLTILREPAIQKLSRLKMNALILDLRNNPGGLLDSALEVTGEFIPNGKLIAYTKGKKADQNMRFVSLAKHPMLNFPLVVLINEGSASGSEIVAGALQDYKRATIVGAKSFGKGSVQTVIPLSDGSALRLTTSKYFTPLGREIHGKGVIPDIVLKVAPKGDGKQELPEEAGLSNKPEKNDKLWDYKSDAQVMAGINFLKPENLNKAKVNK